MRVRFEIYGRPRGKERPRVVFTSGISRSYTPKQTREYECQVRESYETQIGDIQLQAPIRAEITGVFPIPKSIRKADRELMMIGKVLHTKKVDCDNLAKIILDSLNGLAYHDDSEVSELMVRKVYGSEPRVIVILEEIGMNHNNSVSLFEEEVL